MTHAERFSTSEPSASPSPHLHTFRRALSVLSVAAVLAGATLLVSSARPAAADQIANAKAEAAAIATKIQATQNQIGALTGQVTAADYRLSQLGSQITANKAEVSADQVKVSKDQSQLRVEAISDYTDSDTSNQVTQMFSSNPNTSGIRSEYSAIATGNVTTTIDDLHTAQSALQATQNALEQQKSQAASTANNLNSEENQADSLEQQDQSTLNSVNANIQKLIAQQQAAEEAAAKAAAEAAFNARVAAAQQAQAQQQAQAEAQVSSSAGNSGASAPTSLAAANPPPVPSGVGGAIQAAESQIGVPYVWGGETPGVGFDCSGLVQWSYAQAGIGLPRTSGAQYGATTHIPLGDIEPGDLLFYGPDGADHVAMYVGGGEMIEAPETGETVHITGVRTGDDFAGVGRVA